MNVPYYRERLRRSADSIRQSRVRRGSAAAAVPHQGDDSRQRRATEVGPRGQARPVQHRGLERRAAGVLHGNGPRSTRRRGQVARDALVGRRHRRRRGRALGLAGRDSASRIGSGAWRDRLFRSHLLPAFQMSVAQLDHYLDEIARLRPKMLFGYASALALLARHAANRAADLDGLGVRVAFATGETLYPRAAGSRSSRSSARRSRTATGRATPVSSRTSARAARCTCPPEHIVVELVDGDGRAGCSRASPARSSSRTWRTGDFPFIRYRTGDMAVMAVQRLRMRSRACRCSSRCFGRSTDFIRTRVRQRDACAGADLRGARQARRAGVSSSSRPRTCRSNCSWWPGPELDRRASRRRFARGLERRMGRGHGA